ncbi:TPA: conjugal transfer protein TrbF, partial [Escherichia coli]
LNNSIYMWNILMYAIPCTLWALASGFFVAGYLLPLCALAVKNIMIFRLKRRMRRENTLREGSNNASH